MVSAAGIVAVMADTFDQSRQVGMGWGPSWWVGVRGGACGARASEKGSWGLVKRVQRGAHVVEDTHNISTQLN